jgi:tetratricopeptide (TPR) repeat protein
MQAGDYAAAADRLELLLAWMPENVGAWTNLGVCFVRQNRPQEAIDAYRRALERDPGAEAAATNLATLWVARNRLADAEQVLRDAIRATPGSRVLHVAYHDVLVALKRYDAAVELWARHIELAGRDPELVAWYAWSLALASRYAEAETAAREALNRDPGASLAGASLSLVALARGDPAEAVDHLARVLSVKERRPPSVGVQYLSALETYSGMRPEDPFPIYLATLVLLDQGQLDAARQGLATFKQMCPDEQWRNLADELEQKITN